MSWELRSNEESPLERRRSNALSLQERLTSDLKTDLFLLQLLQPIRLLSALWHLQENNHARLNWRTNGCLSFNSPFCFLVTSMCPYAFSFCPPTLPPAYTDPLICVFSPELSAGVTGVSCLLMKNDQRFCLEGSLLPASGGGRRKPWQ